MIWTLVLHRLRCLWTLFTLPALALCLLCAMFVALIETFGGVALWARLVSSVPAISRIMDAGGLDVSSHEGIASIAYVHPITAVLMLVWPLSIAASALAGDVESGFADQILSRAVPRRAPFLAASVILVLGALVMGLAMWLGTTLGAWLSPPPDPLPLGRFLLAAALVALQVISMGAVALLISAGCSDRGQVLSIGVGLWLVNYFNGKITHFFPSLLWLNDWSLEGHFRPVTAIRTGEVFVVDLGVVIGVAVVSLLGGLAVWHWRDIRD